MQRGIILVFSDSMLTKKEIKQDKIASAAEESHVEKQTLRA